MKKSVEQLTIAAPAKINLHLAVKNRRQDGFHNLESLFAALDFGDTLYFEPITGKYALEIVMEGEGATALPPEKNIIFTAMSLFRGRTGYGQGLRIKVQKRIPLGGGLGGGSSDAASTLLALNKLSGCLLNRESLLQMAASLGSDVPFFVSRADTALVSGRGEIIEPVEAPRCFFVLVNPGFSSDTAAAFRLLDEYRSGLTATRDSACTGQTLLKALSGSPGNWPYRNDFLPVFQNREKSVYTDILSQLQELGADFVGLSGAGSTCFGVFKERTQAERASDSLCNIWKFVKTTLPREAQAYPQ